MCSTGRPRRHLLARRPRPGQRVRYCGRLTCKASTRHSWPLTNNGGATQTHALPAGSPAVDAAAPASGSTINAAWRGRRACDIGAFESHPQIQTPPASPRPGRTSSRHPSCTSRSTYPGEGHHPGQATRREALHQALRQRRSAAGRHNRRCAQGSCDDRRGQRRRRTAPTPPSSTAASSRSARPRARKPTTILPSHGEATAARRRAMRASRRSARRSAGCGATARGNFRTKGKHSAATVVGTKWLVEDRCRSTLTRVVRGRVSVRDSPRRRRSSSAPASATSPARVDMEQDGPARRSNLCPQGHQRLRSLRSRARGSRCSLRSGVGVCGRWSSSPLRPTRQRIKGSVQQPLHAARSRGGTRAARTRSAFPRERTSSRQSAARTPRVTTLNGAGPRTTIIDAANSSRVMSVSVRRVGTPSSISGVTVTRGNGVGQSQSGSGGGIYATGGPHR